MPVCVLSDVTTGHPESAANICIFEKVQWHDTKNKDDLPVRQNNNTCVVFSICFFY